MTPDLEPEVRKRQRDRARITAILLGLFAALVVDKWVLA